MQNANYLERIKCLLVRSVSSPNAAAMVWVEITSRECPYNFFHMVAKICSHCFFATTTNSKALLLCVRWKFGNLQAVFWNLQVNKIVCLKCMIQLNLCKVWTAAIDDEAETNHTPLFMASEYNWKDRNAHNSGVQWVSTITEIASNFLWWFCTIT